MMMTKSRHDALICIKNERKSTAGYLHSNAADFEKAKEQKECVWYYRRTQFKAHHTPCPETSHKLPTSPGIDQLDLTLGISSVSSHDCRVFRMRASSGAMHWAQAVVTDRGYWNLGLCFQGDDIH
jgi:hypothetical protein